MKRKWVLRSSLAVVVIAAAAGLFYMQMLPKKIRPQEPISLAQTLPDLPQDKIFLTAHRGFSAVAPENTLPALEKAADAGFFAAEFDIFESRDGVWMLMHDETLERTTNGKGKLTQKTYTQLRELTVDNGANIAQYPALKIPTLDEALDSCQRTGLRPQIEIKAGSEAALQKLADSLETRGLLHSAMVISFNHDILKQLHSLQPQVVCWYLVSFLDAETLAKCKETPEFRVAFNAGDAKNTGESIRRFQDAGLEMACWTIDDPARLQSLYETHGLQYFTTNRIAP